MKLTTTFENKTQNANWKLPYKHDGISTFSLLPGQQRVLELGDDVNLYAPYAKIIATQSRKEEDEFIFKIELKKRKNWKEPVRNPQSFYTQFLNNGKHLIQSFCLNENLTLKVPYGIPVTVEMDPMSSLSKYEVIEKREISRRIWTNQDGKYVDVKSKNFYTRRSEKEMKRLFFTRKKIGENFLSREFLKYA